MMATNANELELTERLKLIESMIAEGRRRQESWGWSFVLWGVAYYIAIGWSTWGNGRLPWPQLAWPVTMIVASIATAVFASRITKRGPETTLGRAMGAVWWSMGFSMFVLMFSLSASGRYDLHVFAAIIASLMGTANAASSIILKWKMQLACAMVWWAAAVVACFGSAAECGIAFLVALFLCQIVFGVYCMILEVGKREKGTAHA
jgi:hypothetical protein